MKRLCLAVAGFFAFVGTASAAGTVPGFSLTTQFDLLGKVAPGCKLYVYQAGTVSTPQNPYQDTGLSNLAPNPLLCDAAGRLPQWFVADGTIKLRLTDRNGVTIFVQDNLLVVGPSSGGGGGGGSVDPTTILQTGAIQTFYGTGSRTGFVRLNGRTIGSATSGATERANADTQALFEYLWLADPNLTVSTGRGVSANADWVANKTIALPDGRGRVLAALDDMGNSAAGRLTSSYFGSTATVLGATGGAESQTLSLSQLPTGITSTGSNSITVVLGGASASNGVPIATDPGQITGNNWNNASGAIGPRANNGSWSGASAQSTGTNTINVTSNNTSGSAHPIVPPMLLITNYMKL